MVLPTARLHLFTKLYEIIHLQITIVSKNIPNAKRILKQ